MQKVLKLRSLKLLPSELRDRLKLLMSLPVLRVASVGWNKTALIKLTAKGEDGMNIIQRGWTGLFSEIYDEKFQADAKKQQRLPSLRK
jgi:hypothetical protein